MFNTRLIRDRESFTASTESINLSSNRYIDKLTFHWKTEMDSEAAGSVAGTLDLLNPIEIRRDGSVIISIRGSDLYALNALMFNRNPLTVVATAATDSQTKIMGLNLPLWQPPTSPGRLTFRGVRAAVTNTDTETLSVAEITNDKQLQPKWLHYVELPMTTSSSTGFGNLVDLPQIGDLIGMLIYSTTIPTATAETASCQAIDVNVDGKKIMSRNWHELKADSANHPLFASPATSVVLDNYNFWDFRRDPIPRSKTVQLDINGGVASEAVRIFPIYTV